MVKVVKIGEEEESSAIEEEVEPRTEFAEYKDKQEKVKKVYYFLVIIQYLAICYYFASYGLEDDSLFLLAVWTIAYAILLPIILLIIGFTISGGFLVGIITSLTYGLLSLLARFIMKILGFDVELIFPELEGHIGVVCNPNALNRYTSYNLSVEIEKAGLYGNSFWHGNKIAARYEGGKIPVGTSVKVIKADYWSLSSLLRNSPVLHVVPQDSEDQSRKSEEEVVEPTEEQYDSPNDISQLDPQGVATSTPVSLTNRILQVILIVAGLFALEMAFGYYVDYFCILGAVILFILAIALSYENSDKTFEGVYTLLLARAFLVLLGFFFMFMGLYFMATCMGFTNCGTVLESMPCFSLSFIAFVLAFSTGLKESGTSVDPLEREREEGKKWQRFKVSLLILILFFSSGIGLLWYFEGDNDSYGYITLRNQDCTDEKIGPDVDLRSADLRGFKLERCDLANRDISNSDLRGAYLSRTNFSGSDLSGSDLSENNLQHGMGYTYFYGSNLSGANFENSKIYHLEGVDSSYANFNSSDMRYCSFSNAISSYANLVNADLTGCSLQNSTFFKADFSSAYLSYDKEQFQNMQEYDSDQNMSLTYGENWTWEIVKVDLSANLTGTNLSYSDLSGADMSYVDMSYADLTNATLSQADFTGVIWYYTICPDGTNSGESGSCSTT